VVSWQVIDCWTLPRTTTPRNLKSSLADKQRASSATVQIDEPDGVLPGQFSQVTIRDRLWHLCPAFPFYISGRMRKFGSRQNADSLDA